MRKYLYTPADIGDKDFVSCIDELPLWSAPFGLSLLETVELKSRLKVLDVGCGPGFPLVELAQRLGNTCHLTGIDPWETALDRVRLKIVQYALANVEVFNCGAEKMPFADGTFNLIVSNNGLNNVEKPDQAIRECSRVAASGAQLVITQNLEGSMKEFYTVFEQVLSAAEMHAEVDALKDHIYLKRRPVQEVVAMFDTNRFTLVRSTEKSFCLRFLDAEAMFRHSLIRFWFAGSWFDIVPEDRQEEIFAQMERELNRLASEKGEIRLTIPYIVMDCRKR